MKVRGQVVYEPLIRINRLVQVDTSTGCWNWIGTTRNGYGRLVVGSRSNGSRRAVAAHRYSYETYVGEIPEGMYVCHKCDNRRCVNPRHLFLGTHQDNVDDREAKGRNVVSVGEQNGQSKLREVDVISMRRLKSKGLSFSAIANRFGVDKRTAINAIKGTTWKCVPSAPEEK